jgi:hypothetical protein
MPMETLIAENSKRIRLYLASINIHGAQIDARVTAYADSFREAFKRREQEKHN